MSKVLGGLFVGVFVGALAVKLVGKAKAPGWLRETSERLKAGVKATKDAFVDGYSEAGGAGGETT